MLILQKSKLYVGHALRGGLSFSVDSGGGSGPCVPKNVNCEGNILRLAYNHVVTWKASGKGQRYVGASVAGSICTYTDSSAADYP